MTKLFGSFLVIAAACLILFLVVTSNSNAHGTVSVWTKLADCESGDGDGRWPYRVSWRANTGNGFYGAYQFTLRTWRWMGGRGYPHHASPSEQLYRAQKLQRRMGWSPWPDCSRKLGLR